MNRSFGFLMAGMVLAAGCSKHDSPSSNVVTPLPGVLKLVNTTLNGNGTASGSTYYNINLSPVIRCSFSAPIDHSSVTNGVTLKDNSGLPSPIR